MSTRRRLTRADRQDICRERRRGAAVSAIANRFGVSERAIYYTLRMETERRRERAHRSKVITVTVAPEEADAFDATLSAHGISSRSDGLRRLIQAANGVFQPDEQLVAELRTSRASLNRVGNNVTQIAKRMNEANNKGLRPPFGTASLTQMRSLAGFVLDFADRLDLLARRRTTAVTLRATSALKGLADGED